MSVGPVMITFFLIVVVGSCEHRRTTVMNDPCHTRLPAHLSSDRTVFAPAALVQIIRTAQTGGASDM